jgi:hypothetical protein
VNRSDRLVLIKSRRPVVINPDPIAVSSLTSYPRVNNIGASATNTNPSNEETQSRATSRRTVRATLQIHNLFAKVPVMAAKVISR